MSLISIQKTQITFLAVGTILFNILFWNEDLGLNILFFAIFISIATGLVFKTSLQSKYVVTLLVSYIVTALFIVYTNSEFVKIMHFITYILLAGFIHQSSHRSIAHAIPTSILTIFTVPDGIKNLYHASKTNNTGIGTAFRFLRIILLPILFIIIFFTLFKYANPKFDQLSSNFLDKFFSFFSDFSIVRILFFVFGFFTTSIILIKGTIGKFAKSELDQKDSLERIRIKPVKSKLKQVVKNLNLGLKNEYRAALFLIATVNLLLLIVNIIDIQWVWLNFEYTKGFNLKHFVHEATYLLIISILLSIGIMLYYFRQNLNFYHSNRILQILANIWIFQNVILLISVSIRNYHYIHYFGLAYKRIGVIIFLLLILIGSFTLYKKINKKKTGYYLFRTNSWVVYIVLVLSSLIDWDMVIIRHNLSHPLKDNMETSYLLCLSDKTLPEISNRKDILEQSKDFNTYWYFNDDYHQVYHKRVQDFISRKESTSWLSWNYKEYIAYKFFKENK